MMPIDPNQAARLSNLLVIVKTLYSPDGVSAQVDAFERVKTAPRIREELLFEIETAR